MSLSVVQREQSVIEFQASSAADVLPRSFQQIPRQSPYLKNNGISCIGAGMEGRIIFVLQPREDSVIAPRIDFRNETAKGIEAYFAPHLSVIEDNLISHLMPCPTMPLYILDCYFDPVESLRFLHNTSPLFQILGDHLGQPLDPYLDLSLITG